MGKKRGRPPAGAGKTKNDSIEVRLSGPEKVAFQEAAELSGLSLSSWVRERLRRIARSELQDAGRSVAFLDGATGPKT